MATACRPGAFNRRGKTLLPLNAPTRFFFTLPPTTTVVTKPNLPQQNTMRPDDFEWPSWEDYGLKLTEGVGPLFKRHAGDLIKLLQRPKWNGGNGLNKKCAQMYFGGQCAALWDILQADADLVHHWQQIDPNVFFMHVCDQIYLGLESKHHTHSLRQIPKHVGNTLLTVI